MFRKLFRLLVILSIWVYFAGLSAYIVLRLSIGDGFWLLAFLNSFAPFYFAPLLFIIPIQFFLKSKSVTAGSIFFCVIASFWFVPKWMPDNLFNPSASYEETLEVVTLNVWVGNPELDSIVEWFAEVDADVILIQETPPKWAGVGIVTLWSQYPYQVSQRLDHRIGGDTVLSRYPIVRVDGYDLENGYLANDRIEIDVNGRIVAIYNIHLYIPQTQNMRFQPPYNSPFLNMVARYEDGHRNRQIERLLEILESEPRPYIVGGDFNISDNAVMYSRMAKKLNDSYRVAGHGIGATWANSEIIGLPSFVPALLRIDYVFHSNDFVAIDAKVGSRLSSDHLPLIVTLGLRD